MLCSQFLDLPTPVSRIDCDFLLWGHLKEQAFNNDEDLMSVIEEERLRIPDSYCTLQRCTSYLLRVPISVSLCFGYSLNTFIFKSYFHWFCCCCWYDYYYYCCCYYTNLIIWTTNHYPVHLNKEKLLVCFCIKFVWTINFKVNTQGPPSLSPVAVTCFYRMTTLLRVAKSCLNVL